MFVAKYFYVLFFGYAVLNPQPVLNIASYYQHGTMMDMSFDKFPINASEYETDDGCDYCGDYVSDDFRSVFEDNEGYLFACHGCTTNADVPKVSLERRERYLEPAEA